MTPLGKLTRRVRSLRRWLDVLALGLAGPAAVLGETERKAMERALATIDVEFFSLTRARREGLALRRNQRPVVRGYFGAPIAKHIDLYCREQFEEQIK